MSLSTQINNLATAVGTKVKDLYSKVGNLSSLTTTAKGDLVSAINEVKAGAGSGGAAIDDGTTGSGTTWSSTKINTQDQAVQAYAIQRSNHTGTQPAATISDFSTAADARISAQKAQANGLATLDGAGLVPAAQLPSYVDDVLEYAALANFPATGETGKIYTAIDTKKIYRWSGSAYVEISPSPGSTDSVPEGSTNLYYTDARAQAANTDKLVKAQNLADLTNPATARTNLSVYSQTEIGNPETDFVATFNAALA